MKIKYDDLLQYRRLVTLQFKSMFPIRLTQQEFIELDNLRTQFRVKYGFNVDEIGVNFLTGEILPIVTTMEEEF